MRLSIISSTSIARDLFSMSGIKNANPTLMQFSNVNDKTFRGVYNGDVSQSVLINKIDVEKLFKNIPQSLVGLTFTDVETTDLSMMDDVYDIDPNTNVPKIDNGNYEVGSTELEKLFCNWKRLVGIHNLNCSEVRLSKQDKVLIIDTTPSLYYTGNITVTVEG